MTTEIPDRIRKGILLAPLVFVVHFLEESPSFVPWFNARVASGITVDSFWSVNLGALLITTLLSMGVWLSRSAGSLPLAVAWLSFLMLTNALFHVTGALVDQT